MDQASLLSFDDQAQTSFEACYPADIVVPGYAQPIRCAGGTARQLSIRFMPGGAVGEYDFAFRIRKTKLNSTLPRVSSLITYQGRALRIQRAIDPQSSVAYLIGCNAAVTPNG